MAHYPCVFVECLAKVCALIPKERKLKKKTESSVADKKKIFAMLLVDALLIYTIMKVEIQLEIYFINEKDVCIFLKMTCNFDI